MQCSVFGHVEIGQENWRFRKRPKQAQGEHIHFSPNPIPYSCETTLLTTQPPCCENKAPNKKILPDISMFAVFNMCSLTLCFPFPFPRRRKRFISIYFFGFFNLILKSLIYCSCIAILKIDFFSLTLFLQLLYQPVSLLPLQPLLAPAARARARYPGPLFP